MVVLQCQQCGAKAESTACCGTAMVLDGSALKCTTCNKTADVNQCCGKSMVLAQETKAETETSVQQVQAPAQPEVQEQKQQ